MLTFTKAEYMAIHPDNRGIWTTERTDMPNWDAIRVQYMGKRTLMTRKDGGLALLIEDTHFTITN
tara:strand:+ start:227 stop:421 length:195 start_codon:yes stop_codon:yes gene_type:complete